MDNNNPATYAASLSKQTGIGLTQTMTSLTPGQIVAITVAIRHVEGWRPGIERDLASQHVKRATGGFPHSAAVDDLATDKTNPVDYEWILKALAEQGVAEVAGAAANPRILEYFARAAPREKQRSDEVKWCAAFVNWCLETSGYRGTGELGSRSFFQQRNKHFVEVNPPVRGCIVVFRDAPFDDPLWKSGSGHVGFVLAYNAQSKILDVLGGNQGDKVSVTPMPTVQKKANGTVTRKQVIYLMPATN